MPLNERLAHLATWWRPRILSKGLPTAASLLADVVRFKRAIFYLELTLLVALFSFEVASHSREHRALQRNLASSFIKAVVDDPLSLLAHLTTSAHPELKQGSASLTSLKEAILPTILHLEGYTSATVFIGETQLIHVGEKIDSDIAQSALFPALTALSVAPASIDVFSQALPEPRGHWFWHKDVLYHASAGPITAPLPASRFDPEQRGVGSLILMLIRRFDQPRLDAISARFDLPDLAIVHPGKTELNNSIEIREHDGAPIAIMTWHSYLHGSLHLLEMTLLATAVILALHLFGQYIIRRIRSLGSQIDHIHTVNSRDRARLHSLIEASNDGLMVLDSECRILDINKSAIRRSGYQREEIIGSPFVAICPNLPIEDPRFLAGEMTVRCEVYRRDGEIYWIDVGFSELDDPAIGEERYIVVTRDVTSRVQHEKEIWHKAHYDSLTDLPNRALFMTRLSGDLMHAIEENSQCVLMFVDLDGFKLINDTYGHETGDDLLIAVADRFRETVTSDIMVARLGGDEFGIALPAGSDVKQAELLAATLARQLARPYALNRAHVRISASIGIAMGPANGPTPSALMRAADKAMYVAKRHAPGTHRFAKSDEAHDGQRAMKRFV
ncbi:sensor domain-containing diguanylate cyclase [Breoghania sp.]|uniref:sensor domain-containing diguanylate cyclase n=1 Tax=Breoghania sp. TaxID=2065378 RepID=UPI002AAAA59E|nr:sensor domain-containing diguanylate cyclase [Breoghania sp.]